MESMVEAALLFWATILFFLICAKGVLLFGGAMATFIDLLMSLFNITQGRRYSSTLGSISTLVLALSIAIYPTASTPRTIEPGDCADQEWPFKFQNQSLAALDEDIAVVVSHFESIRTAWAQFNKAASAMIVVTERLDFLYQSLLHTEIKGWNESAIFAAIAVGSTRQVAEEEEARWALKVHKTLGNLGHDVTACGKLGAEINSTGTLLSRLLADMDAKIEMESLGGELAIFNTTTLPDLHNRLIDAQEHIAKLDFSSPWQDLCMRELYEKLKLDFEKATTDGDTANFTLVSHATERWPVRPGCDETHGETQGWIPKKPTMAT